MAGNRIAWVDAMKGIGITSVVIGHSVSCELLRRFLYSFHIPIFFFLAGYVFSLDKIRAGWFAKKCDRILVPYVVYSAILAMILCMSEPNNTIDSYLHDILLGNGILVTWFFGCYFAVDIVGSLIIRLISPGRVGVVAAIFMCAAFGVIYSGNVSVNVLSCRVFFPALMFWMCGRLFAMINVFEKLERCCKRDQVVAILFCGMATMLMPLLDIDYFSGKTGNPIVSLLVACSMFVLIFIVIKKSSIALRIFGVIGGVSLLVMNWHIIVPLVTSYFLPPCLFRKAVNVVLLLMIVLGISKSKSVGPLLSGRLRLFRLLPQVFV